MNPNIDLTGLGRASGPATAVAGTGTLVAPPRRWATRYGIPLALLGGFTALSGYAFRDAFAARVPVQVAQPAMLAAPVSSVPVGAPAASGSSSSDGALFEAPGWVEPSPYPVVLASQVGGTISKIHVLEGEKVSSGALIAELIATDAEIEVARMEADLELRRAELEAAQSNWDHPIDLREQVSMLEAELAAMQAERDKSSHENRIAARQAEIDLSLSRSGAGGNFPAEKAALEARAADLAVAALDSKIRSTSAALTAAKERITLRIEDRNRLEIAKAELKRAEAALADAKYRRSQRTITAPRDGVIMKLNAAAGSSLMPEVEDGMMIAAMYDPERLQVRADVPLADAGKVRVGLEAEITVDGLPRAYRGKLARIVHQADILKNTLQVKVEVENPDEFLKPEMLARIRFKQGAEKPATAESPDVGSTTTVQALFVPEAAITGEASGPHAVWVADAQGSARRREVTLGSGRSDGMRQVASGITLADKIIISDPARLHDGAAVRISPEDSK